MKKMMLAAVVGGSMLVPSMGFAQIGRTRGDPNGYSNRGQCQSALMQLRNEGRADDTAGSDGARYTNKEYNQKTRANFVCEERNGRYFIVQVDDQ